MNQLDEKGLGQRLQAARQAAGFTQQVLCQKAHLSYSTLAKIERGAIKTPSIFTIQSIAAALGTSLDDLVGVPAQLKQRLHAKSGVSFVFLDINGCLVHFYHQAFTKIAVDCDEPVDVVETAFWHYNDQVCRGEMSMEEFNQAVGTRLGLPNFKWQPYYLETATPIPHMRELVEWVSQRYGIGLLTNIMPGLVKEMLAKGLLPSVDYDAIIDSSEVHLLKPEREIYEIALKRADCAVGEVLFVDDSRANLMAAEKLGWHVMWFDDMHPEESVSHIREALEPAS